MGKQAIPIIATAVLGGLTAGVGAALGGVGFWASVGAGVGSAALGAGVGALGLLGNKTPSSRREISEIDFTTAERNRPVPVIFGRGRLAGNFIALGNFFIIADRHKKTEGRKLRVIHAVIGVCEGPVIAVGNIHLDQKPLRYWAVTEKMPWMYDSTHIAPKLGTSDQTVSEMVSNPAFGFNFSPVPWSNTATIELNCPVGETSRLPDIVADYQGLNLTIERIGSTEESSPEDVVGYAFYDGHTESFYATLTDSVATSTPYGLVRVGREGGVRAHTPPPTAIGESAVHAWYLGRHDIMVVQDPNDDARFYLGYWGIAGDSEDWHVLRPDAGYAEPIEIHHLDELNGMLHTLHEDTVPYIMQWQLLSSVVKRIDLDFAIGETYRAMIYSPDMGCYIVATSAGLRIISAGDGSTSTLATGMDHASCLGLVVCGQLIGVIGNGEFEYYDYIQAAAGVASPGIESGDVVETVGNIADILSVSYNTWTGHVTLIKEVADSAVYINFIASAVTDEIDYSALGTPGQTDFTVASGVIDRAGFLDWSWRQYDSYYMRALQGNSSLAAAMWASMVDEPNLNSARWGAGMNPAYFKLSSFESVHSHCVGAVATKRPTDQVPYYAERFKFDYVLDGESGVSELVVGQMLASIDGYFTVIDGQLHVAVTKPGLFPVWSFSESELNDAKTSLTFVGRRSGVNRLRVQYTNVHDEYRKDFAEANDEYDQQARGRVQAETLSLGGISRLIHADMLAKLILDRFSSSRRQMDTEMGYLALILSPADIIEVTHGGTGLNRVNFKVVSIKESDGVYKVSGQEYRPTQELIKGQELPDLGEPCGDSEGLHDDPIQGCDLVTASTDGEAIAWFNGGAAMAAGDLPIQYIGGAYKLDAEDEEYYVYGFDVVTRDGTGTIEVLADAPGLDIDPPGYGSTEEAEVENEGEFAVVELAADGPVGIRIKTEAVHNNQGANPIFRICEASASRTTGTRPPDGTVCSDPPPPCYCPPDLLATYTLNYLATQSTGETVESSVVLTRVGDTCVWEWAYTGSYVGVGLELAGAVLELDTSGDPDCKWKLTLGFNEGGGGINTCVYMNGGFVDFIGLKELGLTPIGDYPGDDVEIPTVPPSGSPCATIEVVASIST